MSKEYEDIIVKAMAYDLILIFNENGKDRAFTSQEIENVINDYVRKSLSEK
jgi:primase-polymerase (primpol)-like protein